MKTLSIIIPCYNEENTIIPLLISINKVQLIDNIEKEIIIIDDKSKDNSIYIINKYILEHSSKIKLLINEKNCGKGNSIKKGINESTGDFVIIQDADLEYSPTEYNKLLLPILNNFADVVYGSRFKGGDPHRVLFFWHSIGNKILTFLSNVTTNLNLTDMETCYKLFKRDVIKNIKLKENRFGFEPEVTAKISKIKNIRIYEVGISYYGRTYDEGKKINWKDGFRAIYCILKYRFIK
jgi:glycosyltransferase involved in cell wall biosynthesis